MPVNLDNSRRNLSLSLVNFFIWVFWDASVFLHLDSSDWSNSICDSRLFTIAIFICALSILFCDVSRFRVSRVRVPPDASSMGEIGEDVGIGVGGASSSVRLVFKVSLATLRDLAELLLSFFLDFLASLHFLSSFFGACFFLEALFFFETVLFPFFDSELAGIMSLSEYDPSWHSSPLLSSSKYAPILVCSMIVLQVPIPAPNRFRLYVCPLVHSVSTGETQVKACSAGLNGLTFRLTSRDHSKVQ